MADASVSQVLRHYAPQYLKRFGCAMPAEQNKVLAAITACRTGALGTVRYTCAQCGASHVMGRSCGNRHCPLCQAGHSRQWLARQQAKLLPCPYFLITFTVPPEVQRVMRRHPREGYDALFQASSAALKTLAANPRHVGTRRPGFFGVLHTWGRELQYHPHLHYIVAGGGLSNAGDAWLSSRPNWFVPDKPLAILFRARLRDEFIARGLYDEVDSAAWQRTWIVDCQAVGDGHGALKYLGAYVFRVAITEHRVTACDWHDDMDRARVTLLVKRTGSNRYRPLRFTAREFLRRYLQHVLPSGFQKIRHYGFLGAGARTPLVLIRWLAAIANQRVLQLCRAEAITASQPSLSCRLCGGALVLREVVLPDGLRIGVRPPSANRTRGSPRAGGVSC